jgi:hypothetical protein
MSATNRGYWNTLRQHLHGPTCKCGAQVRRRRWWSRNDRAQCMDCGRVYVCIKASPDPNFTIEGDY